MEVTNDPPRMAEAARLGLAIDISRDSDYAVSVYATISGWQYAIV